jgi:hypothetical protein
MGACAKTVAVHAPAGFAQRSLRGVPGVNSATRNGIFAIVDTRPWDSPRCPKLGKSRVFASAAVGNRLADIPIRIAIPPPVGQARQA